MNIFDWIKSHLENIAILLGILGFSALGLAQSTNKLIKFIIRKKIKHKDILFFVDQYEHLAALAIRDGCFDKKEIRSLKKCIAEKKAGLEKKVRQSIHSRIISDGEKIASGSSSIRYTEILNSSSILLNPFVLNIESKSKSRLLALIDEIATRNQQISGKRNVGTILIGSAGEGKSFTCMMVRNKMRSIESEKWCLFISVSDFFLNISSAEIGSQDWAARIIAAQSGLSSATDLELLLIREIIEEKSTIIIDALDEIAQKLTNDEYITFINSWCFYSSSLITTRNSFYFSTLFGGPQLKKFKILSLEPTEPDDRYDFVDAICKRLYRIDHEKYSLVLKQVLQKSSTISMLTQTPILLFMLCELASEISFEDDFTTVTIYEHWVNEFTIKEIQKTFGKIEYRDLVTLLEDIAWYIFIQLQNDDQDYEFTVTEEDIQKLLTDRNLTMTYDERITLKKLLVNSPLLSLSPVKNNQNYSRVVFRHESFYEFLVASRFNAWLIGSRTSGEDFFNMLETPGITFFVKEFSLKIAKSRTHLDKVNTIVLTLLNHRISSREGLSDEREARLATFAAGQMAYHLGMIANEKSISKLTSIAKDNSDFWIRRCAAIGLMFGGNGEPYHSLIDEMRQGIAKGDFSLSRQNISTELGFYGDQFFDKLDPLLDKGNSTCRRFLTRVAYEFSLKVEQPNWRLNLFNIIYLAKHRAISQPDFNSTFTEIRASLEQGISYLLESPENNVYPEIAEMKILLSSSENQADLIPCSKSNF